MNKSYKIPAVQRGPKDTTTVSRCVSSFSHWHQSMDILVKSSFASSSHGHSDSKTEQKLHWSTINLFSRWKPPLAAPSRYDQTVCTIESISPRVVEVSPTTFYLLAEVQWNGNIEYLWTLWLMQYRILKQRLVQEIRDFACCSTQWG
jgi:hypothetical protein